MRALSLAVLLILLSSQAFGHARLSSSEPEDGGRVEPGSEHIRLHFSEPLQPRFSAFSLHFLGTDATAEASESNRLRRPEPVIDAARQQVDIPLPPSAQAGWYVIDWQVLADDGHTTSGTLRFEIAD